MDSQLQTMLSGQIFLLFSGTSFFIFGLTGLAVAAIRRNSGGGVRAVVFLGIWSTMYGVQRLTECSTLVTIFPGGFSRVFPTSRLQLLSQRGTIKWTMDGWRERSVKGFEVITYSSIEDGSYVVGCEGAASPRP
jgi:hypothetical protein